jgi:hypothetical protein
MTKVEIDRDWCINAAKREGAAGDLEVSAGLLSADPDPTLPCPICGGVESCDHSVPERVRAFLAKRRR